MRRSLSLVVPVLVPLALVAGACSSSEPRPSPLEPVAQVASPIINGNLDTAHQAVVALILQEGNQGGICSGTVVKVDASRRIGWVLTAAHCVEIPPVYIIQGNDYSAAGIIRYDVIDYAADPGYGGNAGSPNDFAVVRIAGVDGTTPVIPIIGTSDGLVTGTPVVSVGYGRTTLNSSGASDTNSVRRNVSKTLSQVGQAQIAFNMTQSGICQGDSGGPVLAASGGAEKVVGVHSYVQGDCNGQGVSGRVSFGLGWINGQLTKALPVEDCALCEKVANSGNGVCAALSKTCLADKQCNGYYECISAGGSKASCVAKFPKAEGPFNAAANCTCTTACASTCGSSLQCKNAPKCGFKITSSAACATCSEGACCDETISCSADGECYVCLKNGDKDPGCATNAARKAMATCVASKCSTECAGSGLDTGADPVAPEDVVGAPPAGGGATTTTTTSGCAVTSAHTAGGSAYGLAALLGLAVTLTRRRRS